VISRKPKREHTDTISAPLPTVNHR